VVVGSAIVRLIEQNASEASLEAYARSLRNGMARA
jgi:tryptophan synthase alpha subunit